MRFERRGSGVGAGAGAGAGAEDRGSGAGVEDTGSGAGGGGFGAGDEGLGGLSTSGGIQNKRSRPLLSSSSFTSSGLDSRSGNPSISRRVGRSSRLGSKGALLSGSLSGLVDIARGVTALTVMVVPTLRLRRTAGFPIYLLCHHFSRLLDDISSSNCHFCAVSPLASTLPCCVLY